MWNVGKLPCGSSSSGTFHWYNYKQGNLGPFECKQCLAEVMLADAFGPFQWEWGSEGTLQTTDLMMDSLPGRRSSMGWLLCKQTCQKKLKEPYSKYWKEALSFFSLLSTSRPTVAQRVKCLPAIREIWVRSLGREDPLEKERATHSSIRAWRIPWTEEPDGLQSMGSQRVRQTEWLHFHFLSVLPSTYTPSSIHALEEAYPWR